MGSGDTDATKSLVLEQKLLGEVAAAGRFAIAAACRLDARLEKEAEEKAKWEEAAQEANRMRDETTPAERRQAAWMLQWFKKAKAPYDAWTYSNSQPTAKDLPDLSTLHVIVLEAKEKQAKAAKAWALVLQLNTEANLEADRVAAEIDSGQLPGSTDIGRRVALLQHEERTADRRIKTTLRLHRLARYALTASPGWAKQAAAEVWAMANATGIDDVVHPDDLHIAFDAARRGNLRAKQHGA